MVRTALSVLILTMPLFGQSNAELAKIYADDQAEREHQFTITAEQMMTIAKRDTARRTRVRQLIDAGALHTSEDYVRAAFIFQHGLGPEDFLVAHVLGMIATKMDGSGIWISAASLDRYLLNTGKPQIFGLDLSDERPFNRTLLTDAMREAVCAPNLADRARFLEALKEHPDDLPVVDPCSKDLDRSLLGEWRLTAKLKSGFRNYIFKFTPSKDGLNFEASGADVPTKSKRSLEMGGGKLTIKINDDVFALVLHGDVMSGELRSGGEAGPLAGVR